MRRLNQLGMPTLHPTPCNLFLQLELETVYQSATTESTTREFVVYGWAVLCVAGGGAYYFAKKSINADRAARYEAEQRKQSRFRRLEAAEYNEPSATKSKAKAKSQTNSSKDFDHVGSPSSEISEDVAPVGHAPVDQEQRVREKSKYEAAEPFKSKKGDRLS
ncbi:uncharacterized protein Z518_00901 [Rhinocladiella mackenziei CBS 650.93]|uniref:Uncharacterized protein n=1 Tax=Rhinocladiella mackenziei CBS 650.93 TaxID=1442369 RepID=A0A0D2JK13_9EURO|nr:uncharacterized protein Z518_00901 [Rhinocladiella mackenziei CBS 650.93]KIX09820.1 hypothetical protein Z518_00901 [Rhinocladiella mackenziei CBS 650.93]